MSILQNLSKGKREKNPETQREYLRNLCEARFLLSFAVELCLLVHDYGGTFLFEHPWSSKAWTDHHMKPLMGDPKFILVKSDQCMFGLKSTEGEPQKKPTGWLTNNSVLAEGLHVTCDGSHTHQHIIGQSKGKNRSEQAARYPNRLVDRILKLYQQSNQYSHIHVLSLEKLLEECHRTDHLMQQIEADVADQPLVQDINAVEEEQLSLPLESGEDPAEPPGEVRSLPLEKSMSLENLVRRAHCGLGHIGNERLASILRHAKARPEAIQIAKKLVCSVCLQHKRVDGARKGAPPRNLAPNQIVGVDTVWLPGYHQSGKLKMALNCVCWSTRFQLMIPLSDHTPHGTRKAFYQWIRIFGPPERVYCDLCKEFKAVFEEMAEQHDFILDPGSLEAPTQRAITERAGKTFKEILSKTLMQTGCNSWDECKFHG